MNRQDWWSKKLSQPTQPQQATPPVSAPVRFAVQVPPAHAPVQQPSNQRVLDPGKAPTDQISMGEAIGLWQGGEAMRTEGHLSCPSCGSNLVFARTKGRVNGAAPAPRCFSCGWNDMYDQASEASWA